MPTARAIKICKETPLELLMHFFALTLLFNHVIELNSFHAIVLNINYLLGPL